MQFYGKSVDFRFFFVFNDELSQRRDNSFDGNINIIFAKFELLSFLEFLNKDENPNNLEIPLKIFYACDYRSKIKHTTLNVICLLISIIPRFIVTVDFNILHI